MTKDTEISIPEGTVECSSVGTSAEAATELNEVTQPLNSSPYNDTTRKVTRQSFVQKVQNVSNENPPGQNPLGFAAALCATCTAGLCGICLLAIANIIPIVYITIGVIYWDKTENCTAGDIALLLVIGGVVHLLQGISASVVKYLDTHQDGNNRSKRNISFRLLNNFLQMFALGWFIATCYITYSLYSHVNYEKETAGYDDYCNRFLFRFTFWTITTYFIFLGFSFVVLCCVGCCAVCCAASSSN